jgi:hypothetical protein
VVRRRVEALGDRSSRLLMPPSRFVPGARRSVAHDKRVWTPTAWSGVMTRLRDELDGGFARETLARRGVCI